MYAAMLALLRLPSTRKFHKQFETFTVYIMHKICGQANNIAKGESATYSSLIGITLFTIFKKKQCFWWLETESDSNKVKILNIL